MIIYFVYRYFTSETTHDETETKKRKIHNVPFEILVDANPRSLEGVELGHLPRIGLGQEGVGANQTLKDGGEDTDDALALCDLLGRGVHISLSSIDATRIEEDG